MSDDPVLRAAVAADLDMIRRWRNHPDVRAVSLDRHHISAEEHAAWWRRVSADPRTRVLVFAHDGYDCGVVTIFDHDPVARIAAWGFYLDVDGLEQRGGTLSAWLAVAREALDHAFDTLDLAELRADVLAENTAVRRMNQRFGFVEGDPVTAERDGRLVRSVPIRLRREDRRTRQTRTYQAIAAQGAPA